MRALLLARHAHAITNEAGRVNGIPPGQGLTPMGIAQAHALGRSLVGENVDLGVCSRFLRSRETLARALEGRRVRVVTEPLLDEIGFGSFEGRPLDAYRAWAWSNGPAAPCPGGGETRVAVARRTARALETLLARAEETIVAVGHSLLVRYVLDAAAGAPPSAQVEPVANAVAFRLDRAEIERAAATLAEWADAPVFRCPPIGG